MRDISVKNVLTAAFILLALWHIISMVLDLPIVPAPAAVFAVLGEIFGPVIGQHILSSLYRIAAGVGLAIIVGLPLGTLMGYSVKVDRIFSPAVYLSYPVPKVALLPVVMLLFGIGERSKILLIFLIVVYQVVISVRDSLQEIPEEMFSPLRSLGASFADIFRHLLLPAALPKFFTALRVAMATAISVLFFTETFGTDYGIGYFIMDAWLRVDYLEMYAGIVVLSGLGVLLFLVIDSIERKICCWQYINK